jgi:hypothetical protein
MVSAWEAGGEPHSTDRSVGELLSDLSDELRRLAHAEVRLALVQTRRKARRAVVGVGALVAARILGLGGFGVLIASAILGTLEGIIWRYRTRPPWRDVPDHFGVAVDLGAASSLV